MAENHLLIHEIFASVQGESSWAGLPCVFVRTSVCNLRCRYCDTRYAFEAGSVMSLEEVLAKALSYDLPLVEITGGEPLLQSAALSLMSQLCDAGKTVLLETSGSLSIRDVDSRVINIVDLKTPSSGEVDANDWDNLPLLKKTDEVKFVIGSREDYEWAKDVIKNHRLSEVCAVLMGAVFDALEPKDLAAWIVEDRLDVRFQLQLHKYIWEPDAIGV
ncbi:radical SAM protein [Myxococcota bacterium]|nr:radical SAM protein [Myxococcota bacterium]